MKYKEIPYMPDSVIMAQAYVPYQKWTAKIHDSSAALSNGTVFPELEQPIYWYEWEDYDE